MLSEPKKMTIEKAPRSWKHESFGKIPEYLADIKEQIQEEEREIQKEHSESLKRQQNEESFAVLPEEERLNLIQSLKEKHSAMMHEYQKLTHKTVLSCVSELAHKERFEEGLEMLENSLKKLSKKNVIIQKS